MDLFRLNRSVLSNPIVNYGRANSVQIVDKSSLLMCGEMCSSPNEEWRAGLECLKRVRVEERRVAVANHGDYSHAHSRVKPRPMQGQPKGDPGCSEMPSSSLLLACLASAFKSSQNPPKLPVIQLPVPQTNLIWPALTLTFHIQ